MFITIAFYLVNDYGLTYYKILYSLNRLIYTRTWRAQFSSGLLPTLKYAVNNGPWNFDWNIIPALILTITDSDGIMESQISILRYLNGDWYL